MNRDKSRVNETTDTESKIRFYVFTARFKLEVLNIRTSKLEDSSCLNCAQWRLQIIGHQM